MKRVTAALCLSALVSTVPGIAQEPPRAATVAGVEIPLDENGKLAAIDQTKRLQILENLRASFAARGVVPHSSLEAVGRDGQKSVTIGLDLSLISVARIEADGMLETRCVQGAENAAEFLARAAQD